MSTRASALVMLASVGALQLTGCASYAPLPLKRAPELAASPTLLATAPSGPASLEDIDRLTLANNPDLRAARARRGVARAQLSEAGVLPNPQITLSYPFVVGGVDGVDAFNAGFSQDLKAIILRPAKIQAAASAVKEVDASLLWQEWQTVGKARLLFVDLLSGERLLKLIGRTRKLLQQRLDHAAAAIALGNGTVATLSPDLAALAEVQKLYDDLERQQLSRRHQLNALLGLAPDAQLVLSGAGDPRPLDVEQVRRSLDGLADRRPDLVALQYGYDAQDAKLRQAILAQFPSISIGIAGGRETDAIYTIGPHITFEVPIFDRNESAIAKERATREALHGEFTARLNAAAGEIKALLTEQQLVQRQIAGLGPRLSRAKAIAAQSEEGFRQNLIDERVYVETQLAVLSMDRQRLEQQQVLLEGRVTLATLTGAGLPRILVRHENGDSGVLGGLYRRLGWRAADEN